MQFYPKKKLEGKILQKKDLFKNDILLGRAKCRKIKFDFYYFDLIKWKSSDALLALSFISYHHHCHQHYDYYFYYQTAKLPRKKRTTKTIKNNKNFIIEVDFFMGLIIIILDIIMANLINLDNKQTKQTALGNIGKNSSGSMCFVFIFIF